MSTDNLLDQGAFGCIYYPELKCDGTFSKNKKHISKLQKEGTESENEYNISSIIKKNITDYNIYFSIITNQCDIKIKSIKPDLSTCNIYKKLKDRKIDDFTLLQQKYITHEKIISQFIKSNIKSHRKYITELIVTYRHLCNGINYLLNNNIVHYDLHSSNIIFDLNREIPIIIDFGISIDFNEIKNINENNVQELTKYFYVNAPSHYMWCYEIHILNYLLNETNILTNEALKNILDENITSNTLLQEVFSSSFLKKYKNLLYNYYKKYVNKDRLNVVRELLETHYYWDIYSISLIFLRIINHSYKKKHLNDSVYKMFTMLLFENLHPNPYRRNKPDETIRKLNNNYIESIKTTKLI